MEMCKLENLDTSTSLVSVAQRSDEPVLVFDGEDECLVVMRPAVFERILFDGEMLSMQNRGSMRI